MRLINRVLLLSVKPKYARLIVSGDKRIELRKTPAKKGVDIIAIYSSSPEQQIVALAHLYKQYKGPPNGLWPVARDYGCGLTKKEYMSYFQGKATAYGFLLYNIKALETPVKLNQLNSDLKAPQSFCYLDDQEVFELNRLVHEEIA